MLCLEVVELILLHLPVRASSLNKRYYLKYKDLRMNIAMTNRIRLQEVRDTIQNEDIEDKGTGLKNMIIGSWNKEMNKFYLGPCYSEPLPRVYKHFARRADVRTLTTYTDLKQFRQLLDCEFELDYYDIHTESLVIKKRLVCMGMSFDTIKWKRKKLLELTLDIEEVPELLKMMCMLYPSNVENFWRASFGDDMNLTHVSKYEVREIKDTYAALLAKSFVEYTV